MCDCEQKMKVEPKCGCHKHSHRCKSKCNHEHKPKCEPKCDPCAETNGHQSSWMSYLDRFEKREEPCAEKCKDSCETCVTWTSLTPDITQDACTASVPDSGSQQISQLASNALAMMMFIEYIIKKISCLKISLCAKQNLIRSMMGAIPTDILEKISNDTHDNSFFDNTEIYVTFMKTFFVALSMKWSMYIDSELNCKCTPIQLSVMKKTFFLDISTATKLPVIKYMTPTGPNNTYVPSPLPDSVNQAISDFVKNVLLQGC
ncbi:hypothetical protein YASMINEVIRUS_1547 [Yasminevirus sp. GU-2018]|uniref:Uncharacterized protein n=1 Tax=Yasminevirus sp. GU-2018 TaxID=2420051 RepID=A0A5K0UBB9_9VIRU|nr:hypothetical protein YASMINEVIRUS_1547 [Yasminevirus sp. GU-2018]